jgi:methanogenic corrinoid protein MtbC1
VAQLDQPQTYPALDGAEGDAAFGVTLVQGLGHAAPHPIDAAVTHECEKPGDEAPALRVELSGSTPERDEGVLGRLVSAADLARDASGQRVRLAVMAVVDGFEGADVAPGDSPHQLFVDRALTALDEPAAQVTLDRAFESLDLEIALGQVILPFLHELGERWVTTERSVGHEHFASNVIGGRLRTLARGWGDGDGRGALLACPPGEQHELGLLCFGLLLHQRGWRVAYLGAETPASDLAAAIAELSPELVVLAAMGARRFLDSADGIRALSAQARLAIGGAGASEAVARSLGAELLADDLVAAAGAVSGAAS